MSDDLLRRASLQNEKEIAQGALDVSRNALATQTARAAQAEREGNSAEAQRYRELADGSQRNIEEYQRDISRINTELSSKSASNFSGPTNAAESNQTGSAPTGSPAALPTNSSIPEGSVERTTGKKEESSTDNIQNGQSTLSNKGQNKINVQAGAALINVVSNPLHNFASYSPMWTMACLTKDQFNDPKNYRGNDAALTGIIFSSGGRFDSQRAKTFSGIPEYFVNDFRMMSVIAATPKTSNQNAVKFSFEIIEPYSMGLLLQSMQTAAIENKYANYLDNAPYLLKLDFKGYDEKMNVYSVVKSKYFVMKLTSVKFEVSEGGSKYKVEGIPFNHIGYSDVHNITYTDLKITGNTVKEACDKLMESINGQEKRLVNEKKINIADEYVIEFPREAHISQIFGKPPPTPPSTTIDPRAAGENVGSVLVSSKPASSQPLDYDPNNIGASSFGFDASSGGNFKFGFERDVVDEQTGKVQRDKVTIDPKTREFLFAQKQTITHIITQLVISSKYAKDALDPKKLTDDGFIRWFKMDVQVQFMDFDTKIGDFARKVIFRVVPYLVHSTIFSNSNSIPKGYGQLEKKIVKKYEYIYTGQNVDILKFDIQINNLFYSGSNPSPEADSARVSNPDQSGSSPQPGKAAPTGDGGRPEAQIAYSGRRRIARDPDLLDNDNKGGSNSVTTEQKVAQAFHTAFVKGSSVDLISVDLEILGDTYWLVDNGIANHFDPPQAGSTQITNDGSANYQGSDVFIYIIFRTPRDVRPELGIYGWPNRGKTSPFSGIYRVVQCESTFNDGMFKQKLKCLRMPLQSVDFEGKPPQPTTDEPFVTTLGEKKPESTTVSSPPTTDAFAFDESQLTPPKPPTINQLPISKIDRFFNSLGDPNAPPYTGDDPIIRRRLGLPPIVNTSEGE
jgi:hypothetical protein